VPALEQRSLRVSAAWPPVVVGARCRHTESTLPGFLKIIRWSPNNLLESKWGIFDRYSFCCPSCPGCPRTVTRPLKSAPRRRHRPTAQPLRATSSLPRARYRSKPLNSAPRHRCRSTAQVCATSSLPLNRRDFLRRGFLRRDLGGAISPFTFHLSLLLSHFTSIRQIRQFLRDILIHTHTHTQTTFIHAQSWSILHSSGPPELGGHLIIYSNPSGVFSTVTHPVLLT